MPSQSSKNLIQNSDFIDQVKSLIIEGQKHVVRNVNAAMLITYFQIGRRIVEEEQHGSGRAEYGQKLLKNLSKELSADFGKGYSVDNLQYMRKFYLTYSKYETVSRISEMSNIPISETSSRISEDFFKLSWSHYIQLMKIPGDEERKFYEIEATQNNWSLRELKRQYHSSLYERLSLSRDKKGVSELAKAGQLIEKPTDALKTPYVLEFLELKEDHRYSENELETAIINKLEHFMLELGKGFLFEGRQRRFTMEGNHFYVDLVFYNRLLKCFVLFDLKIGELTHQDIGQMQMYVNYYDRVVKTSEENQTIGIILCKEDNKTIIEFTLPEGNKQIFSREYKLYLPSKEEFKETVRIMDVIYLDNNATTPIDKRVLEAMMPFLTDNFANANSTHPFGIRANEAVKKARGQVAKLIAAESSEIIFTSGATEAINMAIKGVAENYVQKGSHIITASTEHSAVLDTCKSLEAKGYEVTYLPVDSNGMLNLNTLKEALRKDTILVSVMLANNETGVLQPIKQISELTHSVDALFMTDATQALGKISIEVNDLGADLICFSGHKIYAPKGIGGLYIRQKGKRVKIPALIHGGGHELGHRSGTLNVPGIIALGAACEILQNEIPINVQKIGGLRDYFESEALKFGTVTINGDKDNRLYNVSNLCFNGIDSEALIIGLSKSGIAVSNGSACTSAHIEPSHVLSAMGLDTDHAFGSIRFSFGKQNTKDEIEKNYFSA